MADIQSFFRGDTRKYKFIIRDKVTKEPISVDGGVLTATFKKKKADTDAQAAIQASATGVEADPQNPTGEIILVLSKTDTDVPPITYYYDFQYENALNEVTTVLPIEGDEGRVAIKEDITRLVDP